MRDPIWCPYVKFVYFSPAESSLKSRISKGAMEGSEGGDKTKGRKPATWQCEHKTKTGNFRRISKCRECTPSIQTRISKEKRIYQYPTCSHWTTGGIPKLQERRRCVICKQLKAAALPAACADGPRKRSGKHLGGISKLCRLSSLDILATVAMESHANAPAFHGREALRQTPLHSMDGERGGVPEDSSSGNGNCSAVPAGVLPPLALSPPLVDETSQQEMQIQSQVSFSCALPLPLTRASSCGHIHTHTKCAKFVGLPACTRKRSLALFLSLFTSLSLSVACALSLSLSLSLSGSLTDVGLFNLQNKASTTSTHKQACALCV